MGELRITVARSADRLDRRGPVVVTITCPHGTTRVPVRRTCRRGCHQGTDRRWLRCGSINPPDGRLRQGGAMVHGRRLGCGCDEAFWLADGPTLAELGPTGIQVDERALTDDELGRLWSTMAIEAGDW